MKAFWAGVLATLIVLVVGGFVILKSGLIPANADGKPLPLEVWAAKTSLHATLRAQAPKGSNPVPLTDVNLIKGVHLYAEHCVICHGTSQGDASASPVARGEYPKPPQLGAHGVEDDPPGYTFWKIDHGIRLTGMPSWKTSLTSRQMWTIALFLKHMNKLPPAAETAWKAVKPVKD